MVAPAAAASDWRALYPFASQHHTADGLRQHFIDEGPRTPGRAVLMLHGNPTWSFYYRNLVLALRVSHRCVVPDHIGCGLSEKPLDYPYRLANHIANTERLLDHLKLDEVDLVLHDWGGAIGMGVAARRPSRIRRIVVLNTAAFLSPRIPFRINICRIPGFGALAIRGFNGFAWPALTMAVEHRKRMTAAVRAGFLAPYNSWANRIATLRFVQDISLHPGHPTWGTMKEIEAALPKFVKTPMQIGWGMKDWCFDTSFLKTWREKFPAAAVEEYADAGHYVLEDAHERIAPKVAGFLR